MKKYLFCCIAVLSFILTSCSTIINTTTQEIEIKSTPPNAKITIDGKKHGTTPQKVNLPRSDNHVIKLELNGYDTYETQVTTKISAWVWSNVFNGFIPGYTIDLFTGSMYNLFPGSLDVQLQPAKVEEPVVKSKK